MSTIAVPSESKLITSEELFDMGDIGPCELIDGRIVKMSPKGWKHGDLELEIAWHLKNFVKSNKLGKVFVGEVGIYISRNPDRIRAADVVFISNEQLAKISSKSYLDVAPELVIEIISPSDRWFEIQQKIRDYFSIAVCYVWIVDSVNRIILVYSSDSEIQRFCEGDTVIGEGDLKGFTLEITELFEEWRD